MILCTGHVFWKECCQLQWPFAHSWIDFSHQQCQPLTGIIIFEITINIDSTLSIFTLSIMAPITGAPYHTIPIYYLIWVPSNNISRSPTQAFTDYPLLTMAPLCMTTLVPFLTYALFLMTITMPSWQVFHGGNLSCPWELTPIMLGQATLALATPNILHATTTYHTPHFKRIIMASGTTAPCGITATTWPIQYGPHLLPLTNTY